MPHVSVEAVEGIHLPVRPGVCHADNSYTNGQLQVAMTGKGS